MRAIRIIDLSQSPFEQEYTNPAFVRSELTQCLSYDRDGWMGEVFTSATHVGTHIDAQAHKMQGGKALDQYPLERFQGRAVPIRLYHKRSGEEITKGDLLPYAGRIEAGDIALLCTGWSNLKKGGDKDLYIHHSPWLGSDACDLLISLKVGAVGIDHFSIGGANPANVAIPHDKLLGADILIFEDLHLPEALFERESWYISAFPLALGSTSGSFARIVAIEFNE